MDGFLLFAASLQLSLPDMQSKVRNI